MRIRLLLGAVVAVVVAAIVVGVLVATRVDAPAFELGDRDAVPAWSPVCGLDDADVGRIVADRPADADPVAPELWDLPDGDALSLVADAGGGPGVTVAQRRADGVALTRFDGGGAHTGGFTVAGAQDLAWTVLGDATVLAADPSAPTATVAHYGARGDVLAAFVLPEGGGDLRVTTIVRVVDLEGAAGVLVRQEDGTVWGFRESGESLGRVTGAPEVPIGSPEGAIVAGLDGVDTDTEVLTAVDVGTGDEVLHVPFTVGGSAGLWDRTPSLTGPASVVAGPQGVGFVVASALGVDWIDGLGTVLGAWNSGRDGLSAVTGAGLAHVGDGYRLLVSVEGRTRVASFTDAAFAAWLTAPQQLTAATERDLLRLGIGIGPVVEAAYAHFDAGDPPEAWVRAEPGWGELAGGHPDWTLTYSVAGDPTLADPVVQAVRTAAVPWGGGDTPLALPAARPGAYEVDIRLIDAAGVAVSGACLRYSVGAAGADLDLDELADGADWGGPVPLRGVELAGRLGVGSHRVQLDMGALVADPRATPSDDGVDWSALPGAALSPEGDPAADLRAAAALASTTGVTLVAQFGSGGDAERAAVDAGTWEGWVGVLAAGLERRAPGIRAFSAWNEPNNTAGTDAAGYVARVEEPFARAVRAAIGDATILGGNTLGIDPDWWAAAAAAGECDVVDAVAVHPYTGWNRAWEEDGWTAAGAGFDALRGALGPDCAALPVWDTESGWTADGSEASWAQARDVARKLLWYDADGVAGWTYFFSEGGFGEAGFSWSLAQYASHLKPGALAMAAVSRLLAGRGAPVAIDTGLPYTWAMRIPGDDTLLAVWTDGARLPARVTTDAASVAVTDQYGAVDTLATTGGAAEVVLTAAPQFLRVGEGAALTVGPVEEWGPDVLVGADVTATSTSDDDGDPATITGGSNDPYRPWRSGLAPDGGVDEHPGVTVTLDTATVIDRIGVVSATMSCCESGLRTFEVSVRGPGGDWQVVDTPADVFGERVTVVSFPPVAVTAVRITVPWTTVRGIRVLEVNTTPYAGGLPPPSRGLASTSDRAVGIAAVSAWAPAD